MSMEVEIDTRFTYHPPDERFVRNTRCPDMSQVDHYNEIRNRARSYAHTLALLCPESRELSLALTRLEEVVFWANAAIARREHE